MQSDRLAAATSAARALLAPDGVLRVGLNTSNPLLVKPGGDPAAPRGIAPDVARLLALRLDAEPSFVGYDTPAQLTDAVGKGAWSVGFLAADPARSAEIAFSPAYLEIPAGYLAPPGSPLTSTQEVDRAGVRISVAAKSAYEFWLSRNIRHAKLVMAQGAPASYDVFVREHLEVLAGLKPMLLSEQRKFAGSRILEGRFTAVQQAIGVSKDHADSAAFLRTFVEDITRDGAVAEIIARYGVAGVDVPPNAPTEG